MPRPIPAHYIKGNAVARVPERIICLDTESNRLEVPRGEDQTWSLGVASFTWWTSKGNCQQSLSRFDIPVDMWNSVASFTRPKRRTVVYAHNLGYDLRISQAMEILPSLGFTLADARIEDRSSWLKWTKDSATLILCDSMSIFPMALAKVGQLFGITKPSLPPVSERDALFVRCEADVHILNTAILSYINWLRTGEAGNWQVTGAGQSWSHWRHQHYTHKILVHDDEQALTAERRAMWTGRCEAWKWGRDDHERVHEFDYSNAYPRIARDYGLPTRLRGTASRLDLDRLPEILARYCVLAHVEITTDSPIVPTEHNGRIVWPIGTFETVLWDPEIELLRRHGCQIRVRKAWFYRRQPALTQWAEWMLEQIHDDTGKVEPWKKVILKHWSRTLIGRFGMKYRSWDLMAKSPDSTLSMSVFKDLDTGETSQMMQVGHDVLLQSGEKDGPDACPQITGYIMSAARAKIYTASQLAGGSEVLYMDTDSLVVTTNGRIALERESSHAVCDGLVLKSSSVGYRIYGPRAIILDRSRKIAGLPVKAEETTAHKYQGETWQGLSEAIETGNHATVRIRVRDFRLSPNPARRYLRSDGTTSPYSLPSGEPDGGPDQTVSPESRALSEGYPAILLGIIPPSQLQPKTPVDKGWRYSVKSC